jgi:hypothetical protein
MNPGEPQLRRRGYFLTQTVDPVEAETGDFESPEGFTLRVRIVRPLRSRAAIAARGAHGSGPRCAGRVPDHRTTSPCSVKSATVIDTHRR